jgi:3-methyladenine DNA glycosylase Mpg
MRGRQFCTNVVVLGETIAVRVLLRSFSAPDRYRGASEDEIRAGI